MTQPNAERGRAGHAAVGKVLVHTGEVHVSAEEELEALHPHVLELLIGLRPSHRLHLSLLQRRLRPWQSTSCPEAEPLCRCPRRAGRGRRASFSPPSPLQGRCSWGGLAGWIGGWRNCGGRGRRGRRRRGPCRRTRWPGWGASCRGLRECTCETGHGLTRDARLTDELGGHVELREMDVGRDLGRHQAEVPDLPKSTKALSGCQGRRGWEGRVWKGGGGKGGEG